MRWSELAVVWLPVGQAHPYPEQFADRAAPGTSDYFYYALALAEVFTSWPSRTHEEPWAYCRDATWSRQRYASRRRPAATRHDRERI